MSPSLTIAFERQWAQVPLRFLYKNRNWHALLLDLSANHPLYPLHCIKCSTIFFFLKAPNFFSMTCLSFSLGQHWFCLHMKPFDLLHWSFITSQILNSPNLRNSFRLMSFLAISCAGNLSCGKSSSILSPDIFRCLSSRNDSLVLGRGTLRLPAPSLPQCLSACAKRTCTELYCWKLKILKNSKTKLQWLHTHATKFPPHSDVNISDLLHQTELALSAHGIVRVKLPFSLVLLG